MHIYDVAAYHVRGLLKSFEALGLDVPALLNAVRIDPRDVANPEARFAEPLMLQLFMLAEQVDARPLFGLRAGTSIPFGALELIDYVVAGCATLGDGMETLAHHARLCASGFTYRIEPAVLDDGEPGVAVAVEHPYGMALLPRSFVEYIWASCISRFRDHCELAFQPTLLLRGAPQGPEKTYRSVLGRVVFEQAEDVLHVPRAQWQLPNPRRDPMLAKLLASHAQDVYARMPPAGDFGSVVEAAIADAMRRGDPSIERVAADLALTTRTLQRRLAEHGLVFSERLEEIRRTLAQRYLRGTKVSIGEIAHLLAYAEPSAFHRAFRRWTGLTPAAYRAGEEPQRAPEPLLTGERI